MMKKMLVAAGVVVALCAPMGQINAAENMEITAEVRYFYPDLSFKATSDSVEVYENGYDPDGGLSHTLDFVGNLGVEANSGPELRVGIGENWSLDYMKIESSGEGMPNKFFNWQGSGFKERTASSVDMTYIRLAYKKPWIKNDRMKAYWLVDIKDVKLKAESRGVSFLNTGVRETKEKHQMVPSIGVGIESALDESGKLTGNAEVSYLPAGNYGKSYDIEAGLRYKASEQLDVMAGYRVIRLKADSDGDQVDFQLKGPYFGIRGTF